MIQRDWFNGFVLPFWPQVSESIYLALLFPVRAVSGCGYKGKENKAILESKQLQL